MFLELCSVEPDVLPDGVGSGVVGRAVAVLKLLGPPVENITKPKHDESFRGRYTETDDGRRQEPISG